MKVQKNPKGKKIFQAVVCQVQTQKEKRHTDGPGYNDHSGGNYSRAGT